MKNKEIFKKSVELMLSLNIISQKEHDKLEFNEDNVVKMLSKLTETIEESKEIKTVIKDKKYKDFLNQFK